LLAPLDNQPSEVGLGARIAAGFGLMEELVPIVASRLPALSQKGEVESQNTPVLGFRSREPFWELFCCKEPANRRATDPHNIGDGIVTQALPT
jgi:hypothetical protein